MAKSNCCGGGHCGDAKAETIALAGVPVLVNGEPDVPAATDDEVAKQIEVATADESVAPESFEPTQDEWVEGAAPVA